MKNIYSELQKVQTELREQRALINKSRRKCDDALYKVNKVLQRIRKQIKEETTEENEDINQLKLF